MLLAGAAAQSSRPATAAAAGASRPASRPRLPQPLHECQVVAFADRLYVLGGTTAAAASTARVDAFSPSTGRWTACAPMGHARSFFAAAAVGPRIYAVGGTDLTACEVYDPKRDVWTGCAPLPQARTHLCAVGLEGRLWVLGGHGKPAPGSASFTDRVDVYDPATDRWSPGPTLPRPLHGHRAVVLDGTLHVLGGTDDAFQDMSAHYQLVDGAWRRCAPMTGGRLFFGAEAVGGRIWALDRSTESWDPRTDRWQPGPAGPAAIYHFDTAALDDLIWCIGGVDPERPGLHQRAELLVFDPVRGVWR